MLCRLCGQRKARRQCPALGELICPACCGTKRLVEIRCPSDCAYLASARTHPAAIVQRQQQRDLSQLMPLISGLTEDQSRLLFLLQTFIARYVPEGFSRLTDRDVVEATGAMASTIETAARGIIYEHRPASLAAQRLVQELTTLLKEMAKEGGPAVDRQAAMVFRRIEQVATEATKTPGAGAVDYLEFARRLAAQFQGDAPDPLGPATRDAGSANEPGTSSEGPAEGSRLILP